VSPSLTRRRPRKGLQSQQFPAQIFRRFRDPAPPHRGKGQTVTSKYPAKLGRIQLPACPVNIETAFQPPHFAIRGVGRRQQPSEALAFRSQLAGTTNKIARTPGQPGRRQGSLPKHLRDLQDILLDLAEAGADAPRQEVPCSDATKAFSIILDPDPAARELAGKVCDGMAVRPRNKADQLLTRQVLPGQDAGSIRHAALQP
ncbi:MAG: hypothetical protein VX040_00465, partial [Pseudomonadota bacterium]|nr:hypothetical protein [Pseudomonadota bacterium]